MNTLLRNTIYASLILILYFYAGRNLRYHVSNRVITSVVKKTGIEPTQEVHFTLETLPAGEKLVEIYSDSTETTPLYSYRPPLGYIYWFGVAFLVILTGKLKSIIIYTISHLIIWLLIIGCLIMGATVSTDFIKAASFLQSSMLPFLSVGLIGLLYYLSETSKS